MQKAMERVEQMEGSDAKGHGLLTWLWKTKQHKHWNWGSITVNEALHALLLISSILTAS
jgi:hypothetical protein